VLDIKPANIMVVADTAVPGGERTKLLDFGIAKLRESSPVKAANTHKDLLMGTPSYMSPEQCRGAGGVDEKTDVYSLGIVLYRALAGRLPFMAGGAGDIMAQHIYQPAPALGELAPWLPGSLTELVHRLISKDKEQRPTMAEVVAELDRLAGELADFKLPELPRDPSLSAELEGLLESTPGTDPEAEEDEVAETMGVGETPALGVERMSAARSPSSTGGRLASSPSQIGWSIANTGRRPGAAGLLALLAVVAAVGIGSGLWLTGRQRRPVEKAASSGPAARGTPPAAAETAPRESAAAPRAATSAVAAPATVEWQLETTPPGAEILRVADHKLLGRTPWHGEVASGSGSEELRLSLPGHIERLVSVSRSSNVRRSFALVPSGAASAGSGKAGPRPPVAKGGKNRKKGHVKIEFED
jgi:serine/threonine-protein kinase